MNYINLVNEILFTVCGIPAGLMIINVISPDTIPYIDCLIHVTFLVTVGLAVVEVYLRVYYKKVLEQEKSPKSRRIQ
jgi:hypothetical protein